MGVYPRLQGYPHRVYIFAEVIYCGGEVLLPDEAPGRKRI